MKNLNIIIIVVAVVLLGGLIFASSFMKNSAKDNKNPLVLQPDQKSTQQQNDPSVPFTTKVKVDISNFTFSPASLTVKPGETITVTNKDSIGHTFTSDTGLFNTKLIDKNESVEVKAPMQVGEYNYHCTPHPNMKGKIIVKE